VVTEIFDSSDRVTLPLVPERVPLATYRLQLTPDFGFDAATDVLEHLEVIGISHAYCSPYLQAAPGSTHGYDIVDHSRINEELGGAAAHDRFVAALAERGLGQVVDIVPNHMAVGDHRNRWWWDVLTHGPASRFAEWFDVDWTPTESKLLNRVLLPVLGDHYGNVLDNDELVLHRDGADFSVRYHDHRYPVSPRSLDQLIAVAAARTGDERLAFVAEQLGRLPIASTDDDDEAIRRRRDTGVLLTLLGDILEHSTAVADALDSLVDVTNADHDALHELLERQNYRLAFWKTASSELDYRRFFDIDALAGIRVENPLVFDEVHRLPLQWVREGSVQGLRVDHPDGLLDPTGYFQRLAAAAPLAWIVAEKILEPGESLRSDWPVAGTTGYEYLNIVNGLFVDPAGEASLTLTFQQYTGTTDDVGQVIETAKAVVLDSMLTTDLERLTNLLSRLCERDRARRDHIRSDLRDAVRALIIAFPVYRTYVRRGTTTDAVDRAIIDGACAAALKTHPELGTDLLEYVAGVLRGDNADADTREFAYRFQQVTSPVMAKAVEDTAFYRYTRLISLNEVGGSPDHFGLSVEDFHASNAAAQLTHPDRMITTSTHDTKRSEDVRLRIDLLAEIPERWDSAVHAWGVLCDNWMGGERDRGVEYLLHQTLVGAYPLTAERVHEYLTKAMREAKNRTSWLSPDEAFEQHMHDLVDHLLGDGGYRADLRAFALPLVRPGRISALSQKLITLTVPGVPDLYQGSELWTDDLVDPDNRRPVDYELRTSLARRLRHERPDALHQWGLDDPADTGAAKLWTVMAALDTRRRNADCFVGERASYTPLTATGHAADHVVAFYRGDAVITVAPRLPLRLEQHGGWLDTEIELPAGRCFTNVLTGEIVVGGMQSIETLFARFPAALLVADR